MLHALPIIPGPVAWAWHKSVMSHSAPETPALQQWVEKASPGQVCDHKSWKPSRVAQQSPGLSSQLNTGARLCVCPAPLFSPVVLVCPLAAMAGAALRYGDIPVH